MTRPNLNYLLWRYRKIHIRAKRALISRTYWDNQPDTSRAILVAGTARSGTTWLADLIASQIPSRIMFEPFHPYQVKAYEPFNYFQYMHLDAKDRALAEYCQTLFSGRIKNNWIDRQVTELRPKFRVVKAVRANLLLGWIWRNFPEVPQILIIRHPCAVVLSWIQLGWNADKDIAAFLAQPLLISDFLGDKINRINRGDSDEENIAFVWCVSNLVPLVQLESGNVCIVFYENLCAQPEIEIPRIFSATGHEFSDTIYSKMNRPSTTSQATSAVLRGSDRVKNWQNSLTTGQIDRILSVVEDFGLTYLYGGSTAPNTVL